MDVAKAADLAAVVIDDHRAAGESLIDEPRNHHAVVPHLPWPDDVEEASDRHL